MTVGGRAQCSPGARGWAGLAALVVVVFDLAVEVHAARYGVPGDFEVYRRGGRAVLDGTGVYAVAGPATGLGFTYPVFAAVLFTPLALVPAAAAFGIVLAANTLLFWLAWRLVRTMAPLSGAGGWVLFTLGWLCEPLVGVTA